VRAAAVGWGSVVGWGEGDQQKRMMNPKCESKTKLASSSFSAAPLFPFSCPLLLLLLFFFFFFFAPGSALFPPPLVSFWRPLALFQFTTLPTHTLTHKHINKLRALHAPVVVVVIVVLSLFALFCLKKEREREEREREGKKIQKKTKKALRDRLAKT